MTWEEICEHVLEKIRPIKKEDYFRKWFMEKEKVGYLFDYLLIKRIYNTHLNLLDDYDHFAVITGIEGSGKSTMAVQMCSWMDPNFNAERICFSPKQFIHALKTSEKREAILMDEGGVMLYSRESMSQLNKMFTKTFMVMRQKNLFVCVCIPNFFVLDTYVRDHRVTTWFDISKRGLYTAYFGIALKKLSRDGQKYKNIVGIKKPVGYWWQGKFNKSFPNTLSKEEYVERKEKHMDKWLGELDEDFADVKLVPITQIAREISISQGTVREWVKEGKIEGKKVGGKWYITKEAYKKLITP